MTVIAYRDGLMACDSCWSHGDMQTVSAPKIVRLKSGALLGQAGDNDARAVVALLDNVKDPRKLPTREELAGTKCDFEGLLALPRGGVWVISSGPVDEAGWAARNQYDEEISENGVWPAATMGGYAAVGSGAEAALSAMDAHHSVTAQRACLVACRRNLNCRGPVYVVRLHERSKRK